MYQLSIVLVKVLVIYGQVQPCGQIIIALSLPSHFFRVQDSVRTHLSRPLMDALHQLPVEWSPYIDRYDAVLLRLVSAGLTFNDHACARYHQRRRESQAAQI